MKRLTDTGRQIERDLKQKYGHVWSQQEVNCRHDVKEMDEAEKEQPIHPLGAVGATLLAVGALVAALTLTALFAVSVFIIVPAAIVVVTVIGGWAFWSYTLKRRARRESSTIPGDLQPGD